MYDFKRITLLIVMEIWMSMNKFIRCVESFLTVFIVFLYMVACYETITIARVSVQLYFLLISLYYYLSCLVKSPGVLLDLGDTSIRGICKKCNRIVGVKTIHCEICNKCYHKRDHHCPIIGKCVASENFKDMYFAVVFMTLYSLGIEFQRKSSWSLFLHGYILVPLTISVFWLTLLVLSNRTTSELMKSKDMWRDIRLSRLKMMFDEGVLNVFIPFLRWKTSIMHQPSRSY